MRNRILLTALALIMLAGVFCLPAFSVTGENSGERYQQHLEEPGYTPCADHGDNVFCTHLPIVVIDTEGQTIPGTVTGLADRFAQATYTKAEDGTDYINVSVAVIDNETGNNHLTDTPELTTRSLFRIRGNSSRQFEKKPYLMKFVTEDGLDNDVEVMGMDAHHPIWTRPWCATICATTWPGTSWIMPPMSATASCSSTGSTAACTS